MIGLEIDGAIGFTIFDGIVQKVYHCLLEKRGIETGGQLLLAGRMTPKVF